MKRNAFTLIELLVVVAIIAILAAILFPVFGRARENARRSSCQSNMKQIGLGMMQYSQDYDERYCPVANGTYTQTNGVNDRKSWDFMISPYMGMKVSGESATQGSAQVFRCPSDTVVRNNAGAKPTRSYAQPRFGDRDVNDAGAVNGSRFFAVTDKDYSAGASGRALAEFPVPATTLMIVEYSNPNNTFGEYYDADCRGPISNGEGSRQDSNQRGKQLHFDGYNYLFVDGHVKWLKPVVTATGKDGKVLDTNNPYTGMWTIEDD